MKKKMNLKQLRVQSFVTDSHLLSQLKGGNEPISATTICDMNCEPCDTDGGGGGGDTNGDMSCQPGFA